MKSRFLLLAVLLSAIISASFAEPVATLSGDKAQLSPQGGTITLTASSTYDANPAALGWEITLPPEWSLVGVAGASVPDIAPSKGSTGTMEFAYVNIPAGKAEFSFEVSYPANSAGVSVESSVVLRGDGKLTTLRPEPLTITAPAVRGRNASRN